MNSLAKSQRGFTLIEVMVALMIVAISLSALSKSLGQYVFQQGALESRVVATWVAENYLVELQQSIDANQRLDKTKDVTMMGATWQVELKLEPTLIPGIQKSSVLVRLKGDKTPSATLVSVMGK